MVCLKCDTNVIHKCQVVTCNWLSTSVEGNAGSSPALASISSWEQGRSGLHFTRHARSPSAWLEALAIRKPIPTLRRGAWDEKIARQ